VLAPDERLRVLEIQGGNYMRGNTVRVALVASDVFTAMTAVGGGIALVVGLEGDRFPLAWLAGTPFSSYVIPGLILAVAVGGSAAVAAAATLRSLPAGAIASVAAGTIMLGWIIGELHLLKQPVAPSLSEAFYFAVGLTMAGLGLALGRIHHERHVSSGPGLVPGR
jgi:hypothetical protein